jgi:Amt family ammonium transporter
MQFMIFQCTFAIIAAALVLGAVAERARLKALLLFMVIWSIVVYAPIAHWVWGGGLFHQYLTSLDFAGGTVVHICSGATALALVLVIGARSENTQKDRPHNLPLVFIGGALLWFGWFGFNGGSALAADGIAVNAIVVTHISAATAAAVWASISWLHVGRPGALGMITGAVAGLVGITPAAGYVGPKEAIIIGAGAAVFCYLAVLMKHRMKADDALDVFAVHGVGGIWGAMATGLWLRSVHRSIRHRGGDIGVRIQRVLCVNEAHLQAHPSASQQEGGDDRSGPHRARRGGIQPVR